MEKMLRRTWAEISLDHLRENLLCIRRHLQPGCRIMAMVKADAYGHGAVACARAMAAAGADFFGVSNLEEALQLRSAGIQEPILIVSYTPATEVEQLARHDIAQTVVSKAHGQALSAAACKAGVQLTVHIKVDTGMARVGFPCLQLEEVNSTVAMIEEVCRCPGLNPQGIFTHFASADEAEDGGFTKRQFTLFTAVIAELERLGVRFPLRHCCNSAALLRFPEMHLDMVRPGIILYGLVPDRWMASMGEGLQPAMEMKTTISMIKDLPAGTPLSYNRTYTAPLPMRVATVPIGYGDGYSRTMSNRACMLLRGQRVPVIGRVCMDQCMLDVSAVPQAGVGDIVTVFGHEGTVCLSADEVASWMNSINYEVVCLPTKRVSRLYYRDGVLVEQLNCIQQYIP